MQAIDSALVGQGNAAPTQAPSPLLFPLVCESAAGAASWMAQAVGANSALGPPGNHSSSDCRTERSVTPMLQMLWPRLKLRKLRWTAMPQCSEQSRPARQW